MLGIKLIGANLYIESLLMQKSFRHRGLLKPKLKEKQVARRSGSSHHTTSFHRHVAADLTPVRNRFEFSPKPESISTASGVDLKSEPSMVIDSALILSPAIARVLQSPFNKMPVPPLHCLGPGLDPFSTMFQSENTRVSIERLKTSCMYNLDESRHLPDIV